MKNKLIKEIKKDKEFSSLQIKKKQNLQEIWDKRRRKERDY
jgi:hypothetical protein